MHLGLSLIYMYAQIKLHKIFNLLIPILISLILYSYCIAIGDNNIHNAHWREQLARDEHIMLLKFPIILSSNSFFLHLLFSKLFPEMKQLNMYLLF